MDSNCELAVQKQALDEKLDPSQANVVLLLLGAVAVTSEVTRAQLPASCAPVQECFPDKRDGHAANRCHRIPHYKLLCMTSHMLLNVSACTAPCPSPQPTRHCAWGPCKQTSSSPFSARSVPSSVALLDLSSFNTASTPCYTPATPHMYLNMQFQNLPTYTDFLAGLLCA